jgi:hypothetical protein
MSLDELDAIESLIHRHQHGRAVYLLDLLADWYRTSELRRFIEARGLTALPATMPARPSQHFRR